MKTLSNWLIIVTMDSYWIDLTKSLRDERGERSELLCAATASI